MPRFFSKSIGARDEAQTRELAGTGGVVFACITLASLLASLFVAWLAPGWFADADVVRVIRLVVIVMAAFFASQTAAQLSLGYLKGHLRYDLIAIASIVRITVTSVLIVLVLRRGHGLLGIACVHAAVGAVESLMNIVFSLRHDPPLVVRLREATKSKALEIFKYAGAAYLMMAGQSLRNSLDPIVIAARAGESAVTGYALGNRFPVLFVDLAHIMAGGQLLSLFSRYVGDNDHAGLRRAYMASARMCAIIAAFGSFMMWMFGSPFLQRWVPAQAAAAWAVLVPAMLPKALFIAQTPSMVLLLALARHKKLAVIDWVAGAINVGMTWWLAGTMGAPGAAVATCIEQSIVCGLIWPVLGARAAGISIAEVWGRLLAWPVLRVALVLAPCALLIRFARPDYFVLAALGTACFVWFVVASFFVLNADERRWLERLLPFMRRFGKGGESSSN